MTGYDVFQANQSLSLKVDLVDQYTGENIDAASVNITLFDEAENIISGPVAAIVDTNASPMTAEFTISALDNTVTERSMRRVLLEIEDAATNVFTLSYFYLLEQGDKVIPGSNSYGYFAVLLKQSSVMENLDSFNQASHLNKQKALISAFHNIGKCPVYVDVGEGPIHPNELDEAELALLDAKTLAKLVRAQVREANFLLGDDPHLDRRRSGLISQSHGEITEFFRVQKPLDLPVCNVALRELTGLVSWNMKLARA